MDLAPYMSSLANHWLKGPAQGVPLVIDVSGLGPDELYQIHVFLASKGPDLVDSLVDYVGADGLRW